MARLHGGTAEREGVRGASDVRLGHPTPILRIFDEARAREFYVDFLGFSVDWEHRFEPRLPLYLQLSRGDCVLHLSEHHGDGTPGSGVFVTMAGVDAYCDELRGHDYGFARPEVETFAWGGRGMTVTDPFGNRLTFAEPQE